MKSVGGEDKDDEEEVEDGEMAYGLNASLDAGVERDEDEMDGDEIKIGGGIGKKESEKSQEEEEEKEEEKEEERADTTDFDTDFDSIMVLASKSLASKG